MVGFCKSSQTINDIILTLLLYRLKGVAIRLVLIIHHIRVVDFKTIYWTLLSCSIQKSARSGVDFSTQPVPVQQLWLQHLLHLPVFLTLLSLLPPLVLPSIVMLQILTITPSLVVA